MTQANVWVIFSAHQAHYYCRTEVSGRVPVCQRQSCRRHRTNASTVGEQLSFGEFLKPA